MHVDTETELEGSEHGTTPAGMSIFGRDIIFYFFFTHTDLLALVISYAYY